MMLPIKDTLAELDGQRAESSIQHVWLIICGALQSCELSTVLRKVHPYSAHLSYYTENTHLQIKR